MAPNALTQTPTSNTSKRMKKPNMLINTLPKGLGRPMDSTLCTYWKRLVFCGAVMFHAGMPLKAELVQSAVSPVLSRYCVSSWAIPLCISMSCCLTRLPCITG